MTTLAVTWSPSPDVYRHLHSPDLQLSACMQILRKIAKLTKSQYGIFPELNSNGNLHFHLKLVITENHDLCTWYKEVLPTFKRNGFVLVKTKNIDDGWDKYIRKESELMCKIFSELSMKDESGQYVGLRLRPRRSPPPPKGPLDRRVSIHQRVKEIFEPFLPEVNTMGAGSHGLDGPSNGVGLCQQNAEGSAKTNSNEITK